jgi:putative intracellular protease/amidase
MEDILKGSDFIVKKNILGFSLAAGVFIATPKILSMLGLHPRYKGGTYAAEGKKALIVTTSHAVLGDRGKKTGVYASEMTIPYYAFSDAGMKVDLASIQGGEIPIEPSSLRYPLETWADKRFLKDESFKEKSSNSNMVDDVDFLDYDIIFMAGGWGASYDLGISEILGDKLSRAHEAGKLLGSVCHGALGFLKAKEVDGEPFVKGKKMTAVSDKQIKELKITYTPMHPEKELRKLGADYRSASVFWDTFATLTLVDGNLVTGQNQNSSMETAQTLLQLLSRKEKLSSKSE